jgi:glycine/serine hydroxymethyltransferase
MRSTAPAITCNKNNIPFDTEKAVLTSGLRLGTPAGTTRGFGPANSMKSALIAEVVEGRAQEWRGRRWPGRSARRPPRLRTLRPLPDLSDFVIATGLCRGE